MRLVAALAVFVLVGCASETRTRSPQQPVNADQSLRLEAQPRAGARLCTPGQYELRISGSRRALMRVTPPRRGRPPALLLALHGAGSGGAPGGLYAFRGAWTVPGLVIVAPAAAGTAWSLSATDVGFVDRVLQRAFARCKIDPRRVAIGGFSSGAGMALWLGLSNGDRFRGVIALSGGGTLPGERIGKPSVFLAHGTLDGIIPIELGGDPVARELRGLGYNVTYRRFRGGHRVRSPIAREAVVSTLIQ
jgi:phospholipase/carboxylesterase